jgi:hypothetical protein
VSFPQDKALNFWFRYDEFFFFHAQDTIQQAMQKVAPYGRLLNFFYYHSSRGTTNTEFKNELQGVKDSIKLLAENSKQIFDEFFKDDVLLINSNKALSNYMRKDCSLIISWMKMERRAAL